MPTEGTIICCCRSRTWVQIIAWWEIVWSVIWGIICFVVALTAYPVHSSKDNPNAEVPYFGIIMAALLIFAMNLTIAILLLVGNKQERRKYLTIWQMKTGMLSMIIGALGLTALFGYGYPRGNFPLWLLSIFNFSFLIYNICSTYVVHLRTWDILEGDFTQVGLGMLEGRFDSLV